MAFRILPLVRSRFRSLGVALMLTLLAVIGPTAAPSAQGIHGETATARINPEVRLRKLHLVRPDLIPYPIAYEVYC